MVSGSGDRLSAGRAGISKRWRALAAHAESELAEVGAAETRGASGSAARGGARKPGGGACRHAELGARRFRSELPAPAASNDPATRQAGGRASRGSSNRHHRRQHSASNIQAIRSPPRQGSRRSDLRRTVLGPDAGRLLKALTDECLKATFFSKSGKHAKLGIPKLTKQVIDAGMTVGTHTWSHKDLGPETLTPSISTGRAGKSTREQRGAYGRSRRQDRAVFSAPCLATSAELLPYLAERKTWRSSGRYRLARLQNDNPIRWLSQ